MKKSAPACGLTVCAILAAALAPARAQLFENLTALSNKISVGDPHADPVTGNWIEENPKSITAADLDGDGKADFVVSRLDGRILVHYGRGDGKFDTAQTLTSGAAEFRQIIADDLNGDGRNDLAAAEPFQGKVYLFFSQSARTWSAPQILATWPGARNLAAGDFDGDGRKDLVVAGPDQLVPGSTVTYPVPVPVPPQGRSGVVQFRGLGGGQFARHSNVPELATVSDNWSEDTIFPRPVYVLQRWHPKGVSRDWLVVTHANAQTVWVLAPNGEGVLIINSAIPMDTDGVRALAIGPVSRPISSGLSDLVVASRDAGTVQVLQGTDDGLSFGPLVHSQVDVRGGPRALELADVNADGWNELIVASRNHDTLNTYENTAGTLTLSSEAPTGLSPREVACADFDLDGRTDFVVMNRDSSNVSVLLAAPPGVPRTGFSALDQTYPVDGDVGQLLLIDLNSDSRADVIQMHRASAEVSVRLTGAEGRLGDPVMYKMGVNPSSVTFTDINTDGKQDLVTANMGTASEGGYLTVREGNGTGTFGPDQRFLPPLNPPQATSGGGSQGDPSASLPAGIIGQPSYGRLYAVVSADFDNDGIKDLAAGYYDCQIEFFKGQADGTFRVVHSVADHQFYMFGYEARFLVTGDFDQDGDSDLAGAAWPGDVIVLENTGHFLDSQNQGWTRHTFPRAGSAMAGARDLTTDDLNSDGDPDIIVATGQGAQILMGKPGMSFERRIFNSPTGALPVAPAVNFPVQALTKGDFDADGDDDLATICALDACLHILTRDGTGNFSPALTVEAPRTSCLAAGDIDGDGLTDLAGTGTVLWVALSSRRSEVAPPMTTEITRPRLTRVVINEIIPNNSSIPVILPDSVPAVPVIPGVNTRPTTNQDMIEIYNGTTETVSMDGWTVHVVDVDPLEPPKTWTFPAGHTLAPGEHQTLLCWKNTWRSIWATGFRLPNTGATITLSSPAGVLDRVDYPTLAVNQSYARFTDADPAFRVNFLPDPGRSNLDNGPVQPVAEVTGVHLARFNGTTPPRFYAKAKDDVGVIGMTIQWRERGTNDAFTKALLYDDGMEGDGGRLDGIFSGLMTNSPPPGTEIEFYLECQDLSDTKTYLPGPPPSEADETAGTNLYNLTMPGVPGPADALEFSEAVTDNETGLASEYGGPADWLELRNTRNAPFDLSGMELAENLFGITPRMVFPEGTVIQPGQHLIIFCDDSTPTQENLHAPFKLSGSDGEELLLIRRGPLGTQEIVDYLILPPLPSDVSCARMGVGGRFFCTTPTPRGINVPAGEILSLRDVRDGTPWITAAWSEPQGRTASVMGSTSLQSWTTKSLIPSDGFESTYAEPIGEGRSFFRIQRQ